MTEIRRSSGLRRHRGPQGWPPAGPLLLQIRSFLGFSPLPAGLCLTMSLTNAVVSLVTSCCPRPPPGPAILLRWSVSQTSLLPPASPRISPLILAQSERPDHRIHNKMWVTLILKSLHPTDLRLSQNTRLLR